VPLDGETLTKQALPAQSLTKSLNPCKKENQPLEKAPPLPLFPWGRSNDSENGAGSFWKKLHQKFVAPL